MKKILGISIFSLGLTVILSFVPAVLFNHNFNNLDDGIGQGYPENALGFPFMVTADWCNTGYVPGCFPEVYWFGYIINFLVYFLLITLVSWIMTKLFKRSPNNAI